MKWKCGDCRLNGLPPRPFLSVKARNYLCRWQRTTDPDMIHGHKWRMCRERSKTKTKNTVFKDSFYHRKRRIHGKQKATSTDGFTKIIWKGFYFLTISPYLCNRQSGSLKWQNKVEYRRSLVSLSLPIFIENHFNLLIIRFLCNSLCLLVWKDIATPSKIHEWHLYYWKQPHG